MNVGEAVRGSRYGHGTSRKRRPGVQAPPGPIAPSRSRPVNEPERVSDRDRPIQHRGRLTSQILSRPRAAGGWTTGDRAERGRDPPTERPAVRGRQHSSSGKARPGHVRSEGWSVKTSGRDWLSRDPHVTASHSKAYCAPTAMGAVRLRAGLGQCFPTTGKGGKHKISPSCRVGPSDISCRIRV